MSKGNHYGSDNLVLFAIYCYSGNRFDIGNDFPRDYYVASQYDDKMSFFNAFRRVVG
jgi:hypothetical protein